MSSSTDPAAPAAARTVIITGGNSGLGLACAQAIVAQSDSSATWTVVLACRDPVRGDKAVEQVRCARKQGGISSSPFACRVDAMTLDLGSLQSIREFVQDVRLRIAAGEIPPLHGLICNAGVQAGEKMSHTKDGFETTFGVNHLGHFLLTNLLLPLLTPPARILVVASGVHDPKQKTGMPAPAWSSPEELAKGKLGPAADKDTAVIAGRRRYSTSKLANIYFTNELSRKLPDNITANAFDPGLMPGTGLAREWSAPLQMIWKNVLPNVLPLIRLFFANTHTPAESGAALAGLLMRPELAGTSGRYFEGKKKIPSSEESYDVDRGEELWRESERLTGIDRAVSTKM